MRPNKKVLLWAMNGAGLGELAFVIATRGYRVRAAATSAEFIRELGAFAPDAVLLCWDGVTTEPEMRVCEAALPADLPMVLLGRLKDWPPPTRALSTRSRIPMGELLETLRLAVARKRGPRRRRPMSEHEAISRACGRRAAEASVVA